MTRVRDHYPNFFSVGVCWRSVPGGEYRALGCPWSIPVNNPKSSPQDVLGDDLTASWALILKAVSRYSGRTTLGIGVSIARLANGAKLTISRPLLRLDGPLVGIAGGRRSTRGSGENRHPPPEGEA